MSPCLCGNNGQVSYEYRDEVIEELLWHGVGPTADTPPERVREFLSDLYRYEIRRLRERLLGGKIPKADYAGEVIALRRRYPLLSVRVQHWTKRQSMQFV